MWDEPLGPACAGGLRARRLSSIPSWNRPSDAQNLAVRSASASAVLGAVVRPSNRAFLRKRSGGDSSARSFAVRRALAPISVSACIALGSAPGAAWREGAFSKRVRRGAMGSIFAERAPRQLARWHYLRATVGRGPRQAQARAAAGTEQSEPGLPRRARCTTSCRRLSHAFKASSSSSGEAHGKSGGPRGAIWPQSRNFKKQSRQISSGTKTPKVLLWQWEDTKTQKVFFIQSRIECFSRLRDVSF